MGKKKKTKQQTYKSDGNLVYQDISLWSVFGIVNWQKLTKMMQDCCHFIGQKRK